MPAAARKKTVEQADPFAPDLATEVAPRPTLTKVMADGERAVFAERIAELEDDLARAQAQVAEMRNTWTPPVDGEAVVTVDATPGDLCPAHFPDGWPEGQAAVSCQHGDDHRVYYVNGNPPPMQKTTGMRGVVQAFDPAAWPDEV